MTQQNNLAAQMATELFDVVHKYSNQMTVAELLGILEIHKQELVWNHFNEVKKEMLMEKSA